MDARVTAVAVAAVLLAGCGAVAATPAASSSSSTRSIASSTIHPASATSKSVASAAPSSAAPSNAAPSIRPPALSSSDAGRASTNSAHVAPPASRIVAPVAAVSTQAAKAPIAAPSVSTAGSPCPAHTSAVIGPAGLAVVPLAEAASIGEVLHNPAFNQPAVVAGTVGYFLGPKREEQTFACSTDANLVLVTSLSGSSSSLAVMVPGPTSRALSLLLLDTDGHHAEIVGKLLKGANGSPYIVAKGIYSTSPSMKGIYVA